MTHQDWVNIDIAFLLFASASYVTAVVVGVKPRYVIPGVTALTIAFVVFVLVRDQEDAYAFGLRWDNFADSLNSIVPATLICGAFLIGYGWWTKKAVWSWRIMLLMPVYVLWGLVQQWVFQGILNRRLQEFVENPVAASLLTGAVFCAVHVPRWWLVGLTAVVGPMWAMIYCFSPNLWSLALSHAILGALAYFCFNGEDPLKTL